MISVATHLDGMDRLYSNNCLDGRDWTFGARCVTRGSVELILMRVHDALNFAWGVNSNYVAPELRAISG